MWIVDPEVSYAIFQKEGKEFLDVIPGVRIWDLDSMVTLFGTDSSLKPW